MLTKNILLALAFATAGFTQEIDNNDIPNECRSVCESIVNAAQTCDQTRDGDQVEVDCICQSEGASTSLPLCEACVFQFDDDDDDERETDVNELLRSCSFETTSYDPSATMSMGSMSSAPASGSATPTSAGPQSNSASSPTPTGNNNNDDDNDDHNDDDDDCDRDDQNDPDCTNAGGAGGSAQSSGPLEQTGNAAPAPTAMSAAAGLGVMGIALGML